MDGLKPKPSGLNNKLNIRQYETENKTQPDSPHIRDLEPVLKEERGNNPNPLRKTDIPPIKTETNRKPYLELVDMIKKLPKETIQKHREKPKA